MATILDHVTVGFSWENKTYLTTTTKRTTVIYDLSTRINGQSEGRLRGRASHTGGPLLTSGLSSGFWPLTASWRSLPARWEDNPRSRNPSPFICLSLRPALLPLFSVIWLHLPPLAPKLETWLDAVSLSCKASLSPICAAPPAIALEPVPYPPSRATVLLTCQTV